VDHAVQALKADFQAFCGKSLIASPTIAKYAYFFILIDRRCRSFHCIPVALIPRAARELLISNTPKRFLLFHRVKLASHFMISIMDSRRLCATDGSEAYEMALQWRKRRVSMGGT